MPGAHATGNASHQFAMRSLAKEIGQIASYILIASCVAEAEGALDPSSALRSGP